MSSIWNFIVKWILIGCAGALLLIAVGLALIDRVAAGSLVAGLFIVVSLFHYMPQMESFKAYGVEAKWREKISEADEILRKLRQSTIASAKLTYLILGWGSRVGGAPPEQVRAVADQVDAALLNLDIEADSIRALKDDYLFFTIYDLFQVYDGIVQLKIDKALTACQARLNSMIGDDLSEARALLTEEMTALREKQKPIDLLQALRNVEPRHLCLMRLPTVGLSESDTSVLRNFATQISTEMDLCRNEGRVTDRALQLLAHYRSTDGRQALYNELFKEEHA
ncbi:hypothetical protein [Bradyrhizobium sp. SZCCHNS3052]|uniref:hypothetical protein n=1 Tax=Bradyrhizobium sp. SZCCHNS3052 TaxID=3057321 RepID=UPI0029169A2F|nr:hypothetical protein [Bradyrhizobium sp. SZCCHNS3052]